MLLVNEFDKVHCVMPIQVIRTVHQISVYRAHTFVEQRKQQAARLTSLAVMTKDNVILSILLCGRMIVVRDAR